MISNSLNQNKKMILANHIVAGAAVASFIPDNPILGFTAGFLSHFVLDAIPHSHYKLESLVEDKNNKLDKDMPINKKFFRDLVKIGLDCLFGLFVSYILFGVYFKIPIFIIMAGATGAVFPDFLQFVYMKWKHEPLLSLQKIHSWIDNGRD